MNAKQIKPYTFWIVAGVIIVVELGLIGFYSPTDADGNTPEQVKNTLDNDFKKLQDLYDRAGREPKGVYDPENPTDIANLTGFPDLVVPAGFTGDNLPVGLSFFGLAFSEPKLLSLGYSFEQATKARRRPVHTPALPGESISVP